ncbi:MAG: hypothetical protein F6K47_29830 [Symploca sp. SIO2E6]|nr:hypothetical protein [Symploca sp. SIO2E6]
MITRIMAFVITALGVFFAFIIISHLTHGGGWGDKEDGEDKGDKGGKPRIFFVNKV